MKTAKDVLDFWFSDEVEPLQFAEDPDLDRKIEEEFMETWERAKEGLLMDWRETIEGRVAEIIVLDQFSRNLWRNDIRTYTQDKMAIALAQEVVAMEEYEDLEEKYKKFVLLPFMHSESLELHDWALPYYEALEDDTTLKFEIMHREVLEEFGRYPYQNEDLGRESTPEEKKILEEKEGHFYG